MYSLKCDYYTKQFITIDELINDVMMSGMDPNYEITCNGTRTGEYVSDLIQYQAYKLNRFIFNQLKKTDI